MSSRHENIVFKKLTSRYRSCTTLIYKLKQAVVSHALSTHSDKGLLMESVCGDPGAITKGTIAMLTSAMEMLQLLSDETH